ncbi:hypothetical protein [Nonomuraea sp. B5E05]|uniref:hypothetical protein n=1 Tax=Nonomuraea sp. B5E05 TaxID=3153569 RepID=UPI0032600D19
MDRLEQRKLLPAEHLVDSGYTSVVGMHQAARRTITLIGPLRLNNSWQHRTQPGFSRDAFTIDRDRRQVTCPHRQDQRRRDRASRPGPLPGSDVRPQAV